MIKGLVFAAAFLVLFGHGWAQESGAYGPHGTGPIRAVNCKQSPADGRCLPEYDIGPQPRAIPILFVGAKASSKLISVKDNGRELVSIPHPIKRGDEARVIRAAAIILQILSARPEDQIRTALPTLADALLDVSELLDAQHPAHCIHPDAAECLPSAPPGAKCCTNCHHPCTRKNS